MKWSTAHASNLGCYLVLSVTQHSLHGPMCSLLDSFLNLSIRRRLGQTACQVHHWHVSHWHPERHACQLTGERERGRTTETCVIFLFFLNPLVKIRKGASDYQTDTMSLPLPIELRDDFAHSLGGTSGSWNDVLVGSTAITPGLGAGTIHCLLGGCVCMDGSLKRGASYYSITQILLGACVWFTVIYH